jgi:hypothetical protein
MAGLLKGTPTSLEAVKMQVSVTGAMVKGQVSVATAPVASVTWIVKVPAAAGVPAMAPVEELSVRPGGSEPVATENV